MDQERRGVKCQFSKDEHLIATLNRQGTRNLTVISNNPALDSAGSLDRCTLPLTGAGVVVIIVTELAVIDVSADGLMVRELADGIDFDQLQARTGARLSRPALLARSNIAALSAGGEL